MVVHRHRTLGALVLVGRQAGRNAALEVTVLGHGLVLLRYRRQPSAKAGRRTTPA